MSGSQKAAFVASVYRHFRAFHMPYIELLQKNGYEVHAIAADDYARSDVEGAGVICHDISIRRWPFHRENLRALRDLTALFREQQFHLAHMHTPVAGILGRLAAKRAGVLRVLYTAHGFHFYQGATLLNWLLYYPLEGVMARFTDRLITINQEDYERARSFAVRDCAYYVPGVGLNTASYQVQNAPVIRQRKRSELGILPDEFLIICIAELNENKNQRQLLTALRLLKERGQFVKCLLVGLGETEKELREQVQNQGLVNQVLFLGHREDIAELLAAADVCALLSWREGLPRCLMEAMAAGKPIVATRVRGSRDLVRHEQTGFLVQPGDVYETAAAIERLSRSPELCATMGKQGQILSEEFDISVILPQMERIYLSECVMEPEWQLR